jgi:hypothetical protein
VSWPPQAPPDEILPVMAGSFSEPPHEEIEPTLLHLSQTLSEPPHEEIDTSLLQLTQHICTSQKPQTPQAGDEDNEEKKCGTYLQRAD